MWIRSSETRQQAVPKPNAPDPEQTSRGGAHRWPTSVLIIKDADFALENLLRRFTPTWDRFKNMGV